MGTWRPALCLEPFQDSKVPSRLRQSWYVCHSRDIDLAKLPNGFVSHTLKMRPQGCDYCLCGQSERVSSSYSELGEKFCSIEVYKILNRYDIYSLLRDTSQVCVIKIQKIPQIPSSHMEQSKVFSMHNQNRLSQTINCM
jgi:hypothetical protein